MVNSDAPIRALAERLDDLVVTIGKSPTFDALPENLRTSWKLTPAIFDEIKAATDTPERRDNLHIQLGKAFEPLIRLGVLGYDALPPQEELSRTLSIRTVGKGVDGRPRSFRGSGSFRNESRSLKGRSIKTSSPPSPRPGSARPSSDWSPTSSPPRRPSPTMPAPRSRSASRRGVGSRDLFDTFRRHDLLVEQNQMIGEEQLLFLRAEHDRANALQTIGDRFRRMGSMVLLVARPVRPRSAITSIATNLGSRAI